MKQKKIKDQNEFMPDDKPVGDNLLLRILLWDIDGTLIRSAQAGSFKEYTAPMLERVFGTAGRLGEMSVSGMTDLQIVAEALRDDGITKDQILARSDELMVRYMLEMERVTCNGNQFFQLLPGVHEILEATSLHSRFHNSLLTGNIKPAAHLKLRLVGLSKFFELPGAFGDDSYDRKDLPVRAHERINRYLNLDLQPSQFIVIGDTPNDIACARHFGMRCLAVGTGRMYGVKALQPFEPDALLPDLSDTKLVMQTLNGL